MRESESRILEKKLTEEEFKFVEPALMLGQSILA